MKFPFLSLAAVCVAAISSAQGMSDPAVRQADKAAKQYLRDHKDAKVMPTRVLVRFQPKTLGNDRAAAVASVHGLRMYQYKLVDGLELIDTPMGSAKAAEALKHNPHVLYAEQDHVIHATQTIPSDPYFSNLWGMSQASDADIDAPEAWDLYKGDPNFVVAVTDTGVDYTHEDLAANIWTNPGEIPGDGIDNDGNGYIDDVHGYDFYANDGDPMDEHNHGTHCSGTIGGVGDNGVGVTGVNWHVKIMACRFLGADGSGTSADAMRALDYLRTMNVKVSSNSWGGDGYEQAMYDAIQGASSFGHLFVCAAGNDATDNDAVPFYPATYACDNLISVAAIDSTGARAYFSNWGANGVDLGAPGQSILSTVRGNGYAYFSGTSMATPHVSGVTTLLYSLHPTWTYTQVKNRILSTTKPMTSMGGITQTGGIIDAYNAIHNTAPVVNLIAPSNGATSVQGSAVTFTATASDDHDGDVTSSIVWTDSVQGQIGIGGSFTRSDLKAGPHTITASVTDADGVNATSSVNITVNNTAPTVTIGSPSNGATIVQGSNVTFTGSASDVQDGDLSASIAWTSSLQGNLGTGASFSKSNLVAGTHTITAQVTDAGGLTISSSVTITVQNTAPAVSITAPANGAIYNQGATVTLSGTSNDQQDGNLSSGIVWSSSINGALGTGASFSSSTLSLGAHTITAKSTDAGGLTTTKTISITIQAVIPEVPGAPTAVKASSGVARVTWADNSRFETGFQVDRQVKSGSNWISTIVNVGANVTSINDSAGSNAQVRYRVRSVNSAGASAWSAFSGTVKL